MTTIVRRKMLGLASTRGICEHSKQGIKMVLNTNGIPNDSLYIRWGCTSSVPNRDAKVINSSKAIHRVTDKAGFRGMLTKEGLCPETWMHYNDVPAYDDSIYPLIVRTATHAQGRGLWLVNKPVELRDAVKKAGHGCYINRFIPKVAEYRAYVVQGRLVALARKYPADEKAIAWNLAQGGEYENVPWSQWPMAVVNNALRSFELTKLHFSGIDIMLDKDGRAYCLEANSAPTSSPYRQKCLAKAFDYMINTAQYGRRIFDEKVTYATWKDAIHPAIGGG